MKLIKVTSKTDDVETWLNPNHIVGVTVTDGEVTIGVNGFGAFPVDQSAEDIVKALEAL